MKPFEPREALWTQANKVALRPGDIVRFSYAADSPGNPIVGKVAEVDHGDYIIYFEQAPEELQKFSRTAAAPITFDPDGRNEMIDLYLAPGKQKYIFRMAKVYSDPNIRCPELVKYWAKDADGCEAVFPTPSSCTGITIDRTGCEISTMRHWCEEVPTRTRTRWTFSRDKWAEDLNNLPDALGFDPSKRKWPSNLDGCVVWFDSDEDVVGTAYDEYGTSFGIHRNWCIDEIIEEDNTNVRP